MTAMFQKATSPLNRPANRRSPAIDRFFAKVRIEEGSSCWLWTAYRLPNGYGQFGDATRLYYAHRWAYEHFIGPIPQGLHIDHICSGGSRGCVNPNHLEAVTQADNNRRMWARGERTR